MYKKRIERGRLRVWNVRYNGISVTIMQTSEMSRLGRDYSAKPR